MADSQSERTLRRRLPVLVHRVLVTYGAVGAVSMVRVFSDRVDDGIIERSDGDPAVRARYAVRTYTMRYNAAVYDAQFTENNEFLITDGEREWSIQSVGEKEELGRAEFMTIQAIRVVQTERPALTVSVEEVLELLGDTVAVSMQVGAGVPVVVMAYYEDKGPGDSQDVDALPGVYARRDYTVALHAATYEGVLGAMAVTVTHGVDVWNVRGVRAGEERRTMVLSVEKLTRRVVPAVTIPITIQRTVNSVLVENMVLAERRDGPGFERYERPIGDVVDAVVFYGLRLYTVAYIDAVYESQFSDTAMTVVDGGRAWTIRNIRRLDEFAANEYMEIAAEIRILNA